MGVSFVEACAFEGYCWWCVFSAGEAAAFGAVWVVYWLGDWLGGVVLVLAVGALPCVAWHVFEQFFP